MKVNKIIIGDSLDILKTLDNDFVDVVITSPPYYAHRLYNSGDKEIGREQTQEEYIRSILRITDEVKRVLKPTGSFWLNLGDSYNGKSLQMIPDKIAIRMMEEQGWFLRNKIIWTKMFYDGEEAYGNCQPTSARDRFQASYEPIYFFTKSKDYFSNLNEIGLPLKKSTIVRFFGGFNSEKTDSAGYAVVNNENRNRMGDKLKKLYGINSIEEAKALTEEDLVRLSKLHCRNIPDVWELGVSSTHRGSHIATFPDKLPETIIKFACPSEGIVLDPFSGSGTTCAMAKKLGRNYIGIELNEKYAEESKKLLEEIK